MRLVSWRMLFVGIMDCVLFWLEFVTEFGKERKMEEIVNVSLHGIMVLMRAIEGLDLLIARDTY